MASALAWANASFPFFNRSQGRDHVVTLTMDRGACYLKPSDLNRHVIKVVGWVVGWVVG